MSDDIKNKFKSWKEECLALKTLGKSNREIARKLLGKSSQESKVRRYLKTISFINEQNKNIVKENKLKILLWDIETSVKRSWHFQQDKYLGSEQIDKDFFILSHAWQWYDSENPNESVQAVRISSEDAKIENDYDVVLKAWHLLDNADVVIGHNVDRFDIKMINARFLKYGFQPPSPYKTIDTYKMAKKFGLTFKSLKYLCEYLSLPVQKLGHSGLKLWISATLGDDKSLDDMVTYNKGDIPTLRMVYECLRVYGGSTNIGNMQREKNKDLYAELLNDTDVIRCPHCTSERVEILSSKYHYTNVSCFIAYRCNSCGGVSRSNSVKSGGATKLISI